MNAKFSIEDGVTSKELTHDLDLIICDLKQIKNHVNNASQKELNNFDFDSTSCDLKNLMVVSNMLKGKVNKL